MASVKKSYIDKYGDVEGLLRWDELCKTKAVTLDNYIKKFGVELGTKKHLEFRDRHKDRGTLEWYVRKFGDVVGLQQYANKNTKLSVGLKRLLDSGKTLEEATNIRNKHKANSLVTLEALIKKYGPELGSAKWKTKISKHKSSSKRCLDYWIKLYSLEEAKIKLNEYQRRDLNWYILTFGDVYGYQRYENARINRFVGLEKTSGLFVSEGQRELERFVLDHSSHNIYDSSRLYFISLSDSNRKLLGQSCIYPDIVLPDDKLIIEYFGNFWHGGVDIFPDEEYIHPVIKLPISEIRKKDKAKKVILEDMGYQYMVVWEKDWITKREEIQQQIIKFL